MGKKIYRKDDYWLEIKVHGKITIDLVLEIVEGKRGKKVGFRGEKQGLSRGILKERQ